MLYINEEISKKFPKEAPCGYTFLLKDEGGKKVFHIKKHLEGGVAGNFYMTEFVRIFIQGNGNIGITAEAIDIYKFNNVKFRKGNDISTLITKLPITGNFNGAGCIDVPVYLLDEAFDIVCSLKGNIAKVYTAINGSYNNITKKLLEKLEQKK